MTESTTISKMPPASTATDYNKLRELGIAYIERFGSDFWTDYNTHDPGITTLEMLSYAITDLSLRTQLPIEDLLTSSFGDVTSFQESLLTADLILPTSPVTELDYRKLFIDIEGVKNAFLTKSIKTIHVNCKAEKLSYTSQPLPNERWTSFDLNGIYDILIEYDNSFLVSHQEITQADILKIVKETYLENRCLCEDFNEIKEVPIQKIMVCADIDLENDVNVAEVHAQILFEIENYLSPLIKRYSLQELIEKKLPFDEIFEGPLLKNGFILDDELNAASLRERVYTSDLINLVMGIELNGKKAVKAMKKVRLNVLQTDLNKPCKEWETVDAEGATWCLHIEKGHQPQLCIEKTALNFYKNDIPVGSTTNRTKAFERFKELQKNHQENNKKSLEMLPLPKGELLNIDEYSSIINDFPENYGIGHFGLPNSATSERKAKAKQFKAYLLFFDQFLANYLAQLKNLKTLFSADNNTQTYFSKPITDVNGIEELYDDFPNLSDNLSTLLKIWEKDSSNQDRKTRFLDHILARFAENFSEYAMLSFTLFDETNPTKILENKVKFIEDFCQRPPREGVNDEDWLKKSRNHFRNINHAHAYNYCKPSWGVADNRTNFSGVIRRIARLIGMPSFEAIEPTSNQSEHIYLVEHPLLLPDENNTLEKWFEICTEPDCTHCRPLDPYSYRVSIVLSGYTERFRNISFRKYTERLIREELPAHVLARICWVKYDHLILFAEKFKKWLEMKTNACETKDLLAFADAQNELIEVLDKIYTIYPAGVLHNCDNPEEESPIVLGRSTLGSLPTNIE